MKLWKTYFWDKSAALPWYLLTVPQFAILLVSQVIQRILLTGLFVVIVASFDAGRGRLNIEKLTGGINLNTYFAWLIAAMWVYYIFSAWQAWTLKSYGLAKFILVQAIIIYLLYVTSYLCLSFESLFGLIET